jgi:hypothetical protein
MHHIFSKFAAHNRPVSTRIATENAAMAKHYTILIGALLLAGVAQD